MVLAAGFGTSGLFVANALATELEMVDVNCRAVTALAHVFARRFAYAGRGGIVLFGSLVGWQGTPYAAAYAATKAYVTSFSEALRSEVHSTGVHVSALCPGPVHTEFTDVARRQPTGPAPTAPDVAHVAVEHVVAEALQGIERNRPIVVPGRLMKFGMLLVRLAPLPLLRLAHRFITKPA